MNGCHWLDEFMFLNGYRAPVRRSSQVFCGGELVMVQVELEHGATFSMTLESMGSDRLGVREMTRWSCGARSARLVDQRYESEDATRRLRLGHVDEAQTYARMISAMSREHADPSAPGESLAQIEALWRLVFELA